MFHVNCDNTVSEEKGDAKEDKIVEIDKTGAILHRFLLQAFGYRKKSYNFAVD